MIYITSIKDEKVVEARLLQSVTHRQGAKKLLLEGIQHIEWALDSPCKMQYVFVHDKETKHPFIDKLKELKIAFYFASEGILKKVTDTSYLIPFVGVADFPQHQTKLEDLVVVLDGVSDFGNMGTIVRTAAAFGIREFISTESQDFFYKKTIDASRGTVFFSHLQHFSGPEAIAKLKQKGYQIAVTTPHASVLQSFAKLEQKPIAVVFGNETHGVSQEVLDLADIKIQIPMSSAIESLNVGVAAGISLYELKIKWILTMLTKKIQESLGRHLYSASKWVRLVFDKKLKEVSPFNANQAIMMMILKCDERSDFSMLAEDAALFPSVDIQKELKPLLDTGMIVQRENTLSLTEKGEEALAKIWPVHELAEQIAFKGISEEEKERFTNTIEKIYGNCGHVVPFS